MIQVEPGEKHQVRQFEIVVLDVPRLDQPPPDLNGLSQPLELSSRTDCV